MVSRALASTPRLSYFAPFLPSPAAAAAAGTRASTSRTWRPSVPQPFWTSYTRRRRGQPQMRAPVPVQVQVLPQPPLARRLTPRLHRARLPLLLLVGAQAAGVGRGLQEQKQAAARAAAVASAAAARVAEAEAEAAHLQTPVDALLQRQTVAPPPSQTRSPLLHCQRARVRLFQQQRR